MVCTFWLLPVRMGQAPQSQALSAAAGFGAFIQRFREWIEKGVRGVGGKGGVRSLQYIWGCNTQTSTGGTP